MSDSPLHLDPFAVCDCVVNPVDRCAPELSPDARIHDVMLELRRRHVVPARSTGIGVYTVYPRFSKSPLSDQQTLADIDFQEATHLHVFWRYKGGSNLGSRVMPGYFPTERTGMTITDL